MGYPSLLEALKGDLHYLWSPDPPEIVAQRMRDNPQIIGLIPDSHIFHVSFRVPSRKNSWRPSLKGTLEPAAGGTLIQVSYPMNPFVIAFTLFHGIFFLGLTWLMALGAYSWDLTAARTLMQESTGATDLNEDALARAEAHEVSDPMSAGAAGNAPLSFKVKTQMDGARFVVRGKNGTRTSIDVKSAGIELKRGDAQLYMDWNDIVVIELYEGEAGPELHLQTRDVDRYVPMSAHSDIDQIWLVSYLESRNARYSEAEADRLRTEAERRKLAAVKQQG